MPTSDVHVIIQKIIIMVVSIISSTGATSKNITINSNATLTINKGYDLTVAKFANRGTLH